ncbi:MAG: nuclear transport factor 2 family protein [Gammaproteobacteria bacterium]
MTRIFVLLLLLLLTSGCGVQQPAPVDVAKEKEAIRSVLAEFSRAYQAKELAGISKVLSSSGEFMYFGTDAAEVMRSKADFEAQMNADWQVFEAVKLSEPRNLAIQVSGDGQHALAVFEMTFEVTIGGKAMPPALLRFADGFRKEDTQWRLIQGVASTASVGQSSVEMAKKAAAQKQ